MRKGICKHYTGAIGGQNAKCDAGINYRELVGGPDFGWVARLPCVPSTKTAQERVTCSHYEDPTAEEIAEDEVWVQAAMDRLQKVNPLVNRIKRDHRKKDATGRSPCPVCGKGLRWRHSGYNGHVQMRCETENCINFIE